MVWTRGSFVYSNIERSEEDEDEEFDNEVQQDMGTGTYMSCLMRVRKRAKWWWFLGRRGPKSQKWPEIEEIIR